MQTNGFFSCLVIGRQNRLACRSNYNPVEQTKSPRLSLVLLPVLETYIVNYQAKLPVFTLPFTLSTLLMVLSWNGQVEDLKELFE